MEQLGLDDFSVLFAPASTLRDVLDDCLALSDELTVTMVCDFLHLCVICRFALTSYIEINDGYVDVT